MKTISIIMQKGGVGKTTFCGMIGKCLAQNKRVLMIDTDLQGNLTSWFVKDHFEYELAEVLKGDVESENAIINISKNLYILGTKQGSSLMSDYRQSKILSEHFIMIDLVNYIRELDLFDYLIIDTAPSISAFEKSTLLASDEVIKIINPSQFGIDGLKESNMFLDKINKDRKIMKIEPLISNLLVINSVDKRINIDKEIQKTFENEKNVFSFSILSKIKELQAENKTIFDIEEQNERVDLFIKNLNKIVEKLIVKK